MDFTFLSSYWSKLCEFFYCTMYCIWWKHIMFLKPTKKKAEHHGCKTNIDIWLSRVKYLIKYLIDQQIFEKSVFWGQFWVFFPHHYSGNLNYFLLFKKLIFFAHLLISFEQSNNPKYIYFPQINELGKFLLFYFTFI